jgi:hypothetical protein
MKYARWMDWILGGGALWIFSAFAHSLPAPAATFANPWYTWIYNFTQALASNLSKIGEKQ